jgi:hypothetical protein
MTMPRPNATAVPLPGGPLPLPLPGGPILPPGGLIRPGGLNSSMVLPGALNGSAVTLPGALNGSSIANGSSTMGPITMPGGIRPAGNGSNEMGPTNSGSGSASGGTVGTMSEFEQCGGAGGNCRSFGESACADAVFPGKACAAGYECVRQNFFYRQCLKPDVVKSLGSAWITSAPAARADCPKGFVGFQQQCGGSGGSCKTDAKLGSDCKDAAAPGVCCEPGTKCQRVNEWYWECQGQPTNSAASN